MSREQGIHFDLSLTCEAFGLILQEWALGLVLLLESSTFSTQVYHIPFPLIISQLAANHGADLGRCTIIIESGTDSG